MRAREFILKEDDTTVSTAAQGTPGASIVPGQDDPKVQQLTASISGLQKQIQDLQKSALQQATATQAAAGAPGAAQPTPPPGQNNQQQVAKGTVGAGTAPAQQDQPAKPGQPMGQPGATPTTGTPTATPAPGATPTSSGAPAQPPAPPGVVQNPQMIKLNIQKQLAQNQAKSS